MDRSLEIYSLLPCRIHIYKSKKHPWNYISNFFSISDQIIVLLCTFPKVSLPCVWAGCTLQVSLPGQESTQELPATCGDQFAQWPSLQQDFALCCTMMCTKVSCKGFSSQSLECINYVRSRQLLLQYSPGVLIIGKDTLPTRGKAREREALCV